MKCRETGDDLRRDGQLAMLWMRGAVHDVANKLKRGVADMFAGKGEEMDGFEGFAVLTARHALM